MQLSGTSYELEFASLCWFLPIYFGKYILICLNIKAWLVVPPERQQPRRRSARRTNCIKLQILSCYSILLISFRNISRYFLTVLSKKQLIQPLGYWTSSELLRSKVIIQLNLCCASLRKLIKHDFVLVVLLVSIVWFRSFRFAVSGLSRCPWKLVWFFEQNMSNMAAKANTKRGILPGYFESL